MKLLFFSFIVLITWHCSFAQNDQINFREYQSWNDIMDAARKENKPIFIDVYATWCKPCKIMERTVFKRPEVATYVNDQFVSFRIQMDTTKMDNEAVRNAYGLAADLRKRFSISSLPTYLFFDTNGKPVHMNVGATYDSTFLKITHQALDPNKQFFVLLDKWNKNGNLTEQQLFYLSRVAVAIDYQDKERIVKNYLDRYFQKKEDFLPIDKNKIKFIIDHTAGSNTYAFSFIKNNRSLIDSAFGEKNIATNVILGIVSKEEVEPVIIPYKNDVPEHVWKHLQRSIAAKYGNYIAEGTILMNKINIATAKNDVNEMIELHLRNYELLGVNVEGGLKTVFTNEVLYSLVFKCSSNKKQLKRAARLMELILEHNPKDVAYMDTYANLLYKQGDRADALAMQEKAHSLEPGDVEVANNLAKMKAGKPTWLTENN